MTELFEAPEVLSQLLQLATHGFLGLTAVALIVAAVESFLD